MSDSKKGVLRVHRLMVKTLTTDTIEMMPGTFNSSSTGIMKGGLMTYQDFRSVTHPSIGSSILNSITSIDTGGTFEVWAMQSASQTVPNSRNQTWNAYEWIRTIPNYETYVVSGKISGRELSLLRGEGLGNVIINNVALNQELQIHNHAKNHYGVTRTYIDTDTDDAKELFTLSAGNVWLNAQNNCTLKRIANSDLATDFGFIKDTFLNLADTPDSYTNKSHKTLQTNQDQTSVI